MSKYLLLLSVLSLVLAASSTFATDFCVNPGFEVGADPAAPPWSLWGGTGGALPNPFVDVNNPSARVWSNFNSYSNVASQNNMNWVWLAPGATYHVHAQFYVPSSQVPVGKTARAGIELRTILAGNQWVLDPYTTAGDITSLDAWVTFDFDWIYPGTTVDQLNYMPFLLRAWDGSTLSSTDTGGYFDNCQFSSAVDYITPTFTGTIKDSGTSLGIPGASVAIKGSTGLPLVNTTTNGSGVYSVVCPVPVPLGMPWTADATKDLYTSDGAQSFTITGANPAIPDVTMTKAATVHITGTVTDSVTTLGIEGATVTFKSETTLISSSTTTGPAGDYDKEVLPDSYTVTARKLPLAGPPQTGVWTYDGYGNPIDVTVDFALVNALLVDVNVSSLSVGPVSTWANNGTLGGSFGPDTVLPGLPTLTLLGTKKAVYYNGSSCLKFSQTAPAGITGVSDWSVSSWLYCATTNTDVNRTYLSWAQRGTNFRSSEMRFYNNGAIAHFGADNGFGAVPAPAVWHHIAVTYDGSTEVVYVDGAVSTTVTARVLDLWPNEPVYLARAYTNADGSGSMYPWKGYMASLQVYDCILSASDVTSLAAQPPPDASVYTITASAATGGTISPSGAVAVLPGDSKTFTIGSTLGYAVSDVVVDSVSKGPQTSWTFTNVTADHAISVSTVVLPTASISGTVRDKDGVVIGGASVYFSGTPSASVAPVITTTTNPDGTYTQSGVPQGTVYVSAGNVAGKWNSPDKIVVLGPSGATGIDFTLLSNTRSIPSATDLLFSTVTDTFPSTNGAATGSWANYLPTVQQPAPVPWPLGPFTVMLSPTVEYVDNIKWEQNQNIVSNMDGFLVMGPIVNTYPVSDPTKIIPCNGATIVAVARPIRDGSTTYGSLVNIFRQNLVLGMHDNTGLVYVLRNATNINNRVWSGASTAIPDRQKTILALVVQPAGDYKVYANGALIMDVPTTTMNGYGNTFMAFVPNQQGNESTKRYINIGRANTDTDRTFNGNIGDVFVYKTAMSDADRQALETDLKTKFGIVTHVITTTVGANGAMTPTGNPPGNVIVTEGANMTFTITPGVGYAIDDVLVDGVSNPGAIAAGSYTFNNVTADHTISATFKIITFTITASAGANGSIDPTGDVIVDYGTDKTFTITPDDGYVIDDVLVDGVSDPGAVAAGSYTFAGITAGHTISATFKSAAKPVGVNNKAALTDDKLVGRLVKVWGKVMSIGATSFEISDGYTSNVTVNIGSATLPDGFDTTKTAVVTGVMNADKSVQAQAISAVP